ncbi:MAG: Crp/Fnr family transcriptional regulator [Coriobacteriales bacterium]|jgi:CRP-like cAMP-binding protein
MARQKEEPDFEQLTVFPLFRGISALELSAMFGCLDTRRKSYEKGDFIFRRGDATDVLGLVLGGRVRIERVDVWGNTSVMGQAGPGAVFAEVFAVLPDEPMRVDVIAEVPCELLFLNVKRALSPCAKACPQHARLAGNLVRTMARKNLGLSEKIACQAPRTIRGKLLVYLSTQAQAAGTREFDIPFDRQQLADYLGVDRSALSAELGRMRDDGLLETHRSHFVFLG